MTLDELLALVRSGELELWVKRMPGLDELRQKRKELFASGAPTVQMPVQLHIKHLAEAGKERTFEIRECINEHAVEVYLLLEYGDTRVCMAPSQHWQSYRKIEEGDEEYYRCDICADFRDEQITMGSIALPTSGGAILDVQTHQKRKNKD
jgi:hypothetical protein